MRETDHMSDLVAFLRARLDEDEQYLRARLESPMSAAASEAYRNLVTVVARDPAMIDLGSRWSDGHAEPPDHLDRLLREVEAKRKRLALMIEATAEMDKLLADPEAGRADQAMAVGRARAATVAVKYDAAIWSDHDDYQKDWA